MARICACDHEQSRHKLSKGGCRALDCYCAKFEGSGRTTDMADSAAVETVLPVIEIQLEPVADDGVPEEPRVLNAAERGPQPIPPGWSPDGASTLARLAKAERERDTWRGNTDEQIALNQQLRAELAAAKTLADGFTEEFKRHEAERDGLVSASLNLQGERDEALARVRELEQDIDRDTGEHKLAAELASAQQELERLRAVPVPDVDLEGHLAEARADLAEARGEVDRCMQQQGLTLRDLAEARTEVDNLRASRALAEQRLAEAVDSATELAPLRHVIDEGIVLASYERWFCQPITGCGKTAHQPDDDHECGPLIRATVTITHH